MSLWRLVGRSLWFYRRTNLAVLLAVVVATGVLTGALAVGDSVRHTLQRTLEARLGEVQFAVLPQGRFFRAALADDLEQHVGGTLVPVLQVSGILTNEDGSRRLNRVQVLGVTDKFYAVGSGLRPGQVAWASRPWIQNHGQEARIPGSGVAENFGGQLSTLDTSVKSQELTPDSSPEGGAAGAEGVVLNDAVARRLGVAVGDEIVLRIEKPGLMPRDVPLVSDKDRTMAFRLRVGAVADDTTFGRFDLQANQTAPFNVFVPLSWLGEQIEQPERANMLLAAHLKGGIKADDVSLAVEKVWRPADAGLEFEHLPPQDVLELRSRRIFIDEPIGVAAMEAGANRPGEGVSPPQRGQDARETQGRDALATKSRAVTGVLTYFANQIRLGEKVTPYSMVAAIDDERLIPVGMRPDEIVINQWLADDLGARVGDLVDVAYYIVGARRQLHEQQSRFKVVQIVAMDHPGGDPKLMPGYPGLADVDNCRDWEPGVPVDLDKIRPKDEQYWDDYRGTPKAFITLAAGQLRWANHYGNLTAVRYPWREGLADEIERHLLSKIDPATVGLFFQPIRERGAQASHQGTDFGGLFLGLSMFLIAAAVILTGLLFVFGVEGRSQQIGMLLAVGWPAGLVRKLLLAEGGLVALLGTAAGIGAGLLYTRLMVYGLGTLWSGAIGGATIYYYTRGLTLLWGALGGLGAALLAIWLTLRKQATRPARQLLAGSMDEGGRRAGQPVRSDAARRSCRGHPARAVSKASRLRSADGTSATRLICPYGHTTNGRFGLAVAILAFVTVAVFLVLMAGGDSQALAGAFFGAGALLLVGTLSLSQALLRIAGRGWSRPLVSLQGLGLRNATRRSGRSLAIVGLLACGVFMVVAVGANRRDPRNEAKGRGSGTGGFAFYADASLPILHDLSTESGRKALGLAGPDFNDVQAVQFRVRDGDDASCLNLNRAQQPRLMGVEAEALRWRSAFKFTAVVAQPSSAGTPEGSPPGAGVPHIAQGQQEKDWALLRMDLERGTVPAIGDYPTVFWGLGKNIGDELEYTDEMGRPFRVRIVGLLAGSVLQGSLVIAENEFVARFPSVDGYRVFLIDAPPDKADAIAQELSSGLRDYGLVLTPTQERLAAFSAVENTYLSIFMVLGGLGLVLGSVGLGLVVLRNMLERRGELAMLRAVGFGRTQLQRMVFYEHWGLMLAGLACGVLAALVAVIPAVQSPGGQVPYTSLAVTVAAIALSGAVWVWLAGTLALRGPLLESLRHE
ncbi:MAG: FtsX-like permease family protein [Planctomycetes bacterium]|nr:FtsX-like permease family protein [Planctomycetota bacterium]